MISKDDIRDLAMTDPVLSQCVEMYDAGKCTWESAMTLAVVVLVDSNHKMARDNVKKELAKKVNRSLRPKYGLRVVR